MYTSQRVEIISENESMIGVFLTPDGIAPQRPAPAFVIIGPVGFVKEQSPVQYATRLAALGYPTLIFDPRFFGESAGEPRQYDSPTEKVKDLRAAVAYLKRQSVVDADRIRLLGICMGANWAAAAAVEDPDIDGVALVAGAFLTRSKMMERMGGQAGFDQWMAETRPAHDRFRDSGDTEYRTLVAERTQDSFFSFEPAYSWYTLWTRNEPLTYRGRWANRLATVSEHELWQHDAAATFAELDKPTLLINSTRSATDLPTVERLYDSLPGKKDHTVIGGQIQTQFYDDPLTIDLTITRIHTWARAQKA